MLSAYSFDIPWMSLGWPWTCPAHIPDWHNTEEESIAQRFILLQANAGWSSCHDMIWLMWRNVREARHTLPLQAGRLINDYILDISKSMKKILHAIRRLMWSQCACFQNLVSHQVTSNPSTVSATQSPFVNWISVRICSSHFGQVVWNALLWRSPPRGRSCLGFDTAADRGW